MDLTIAQLAERTGVAAGTLRMWEARYSFPQPQRLPSGHRRYDESEVELVRSVLRHRDEGLSLVAAIARVRKQEQVQPVSIFAGLRERRPDLQTVRLRKPALIAISHAIEDERLARAAGGVIVGGFQDEAFYRQSEARWRQVTRHARVAVAMAAFPKLRRPERGPIEIPIRDAPVAREWTLVSDAPEACGCMAAWELPADAALPDRQRRFEMLFSAEPEVVRAATEVAIELVSPHSPETAAQMREALGEPVGASPPELRIANSLAHRLVGYLGAHIPASAPGTA